MNRKTSLLIALAIIVVGALAWFFATRPASDQTNAPTITKTPSSTSTPPQIPATYDYHVNAPNALTLVDSQGRRTGKDPATGTFYHEIPGTSYSEDGMSATNRIGDLIVQGIPNGQYTLYVLGGKTGLYWIWMAGLPSKTINGNIQIGSMAAYAVSYGGLNAATSGLPAFQSVSSSTQSITSNSASPSSTPNASMQGEYIVNEPNALILVDSQGRRTGKNPVTGTVYHEIPNTSYMEESVTPGHPNGELFVSDLSSGQYTLYILGGANGSYVLDIWNSYNNRQTFQGAVQKGSIVAFVQNYDPADSAKSIFSATSTTTSAASIIMTPPM